MDAVTATDAAIPIEHGFLVLQNQGLFFADIRA
jgi:hypothetical protein